MSGIIVGVDGSGHSQRALELAMREAAVRAVPLTVLTVSEAVRGYYSGMAYYPDDTVRTDPADAVVHRVGEVKASGAVRRELIRL